MTRIKWGDTGKRFYEAGVDRGVLFVEGASYGVPWSGLSAINEAPTGGEPRPFYLDGVKYQNLAAKEEYEATIVAYGAPAEFAACDGTKHLGRGLFATQQRRKKFDFTYRTKVGNDVVGIDHGYKIHLVYNALAKPSARNQQTVTNTPTPLALSWGITTIPVRAPGIVPTAHFIVDSRTAHPVVLSYLEGILYGMAGYEPRMPSITELVTLFNWPIADLDVALNLIGAGSPDKLRVTNVFTNPSVETATAGALNTAYTNLALNPLHAVGGEGLQPNNAAINTLVRGVPLPLATPDGITTGARLVPASGNATATLASCYNVDALRNVNTQRALGAWIYVNRAGYRAQISVSAGSQAQRTPLAANAWTWVKSDVFAANTYASVFIVHDSGAIDVANDVAYITGATALAGTVAPDFALWGNMNPLDTDFTAVWAGTVNQSQTLLRGPAPAGISSVSTAWAGIFRSAKWADVGQYSLRVGPYGSSAVTVNSSIAAFANIALTTEVGKEYTLVCKARKTAPTSNYPLLYGAIGIYDGAALTYSPQTENAAGIYEPRLKMLRSGAVFQARFIHANPKTAAPDVYFDAITVVEGDYDGPPFAPGSPVVYRRQTLNPTWTGAADASTSYFEYYLQLTEAARPGDAYIIENQLFVFVDDMWRSLGALPI